MRRAGNLLFDYPADLAELVHQIGLGVETTGCIDDHHIRTAGLRGGDRVEGDRARVGPLVRTDQIGTRPVSPGRKLLGSGRAVGVGGTQQDGQTELVLEVPGDLANRSCLARAVYPGHEHDGWILTQVDRGPVGRRNFSQEPDQPLLYRGTVGRHCSGIDLVFELLNDLGCGRGTGVSQDKGFLETLPGFIVNPVENAGADLLGEGAATLGEALPQAAESAHLLRGFLLGRRRRRGIRYNTVAEIENVIPGRAHGSDLA